LEDSTDLSQDRLRDDDDGDTYPMIFIVNGRSVQDPYPKIFMCVIPVVCVTNKEGGVVKQHN